jgi:hypothetical protein
MQEVLEKTILSLSKELVYPLIIIAITGFIFYAIAEMSKDFWLFIKMKRETQNLFDTMGYSVTIVFDGSCYKIQKVKYKYVQLIKMDDRRILVRIPLVAWAKMTKVINANGTD